MGPSKHTIIRITIDLLIVVSVLQGWWFIAVPLGLIGAWSFPYFIEIVLAGIAYDALFGMVPDMGWLGYMGTIASVVLLMMVIGLKRVVRR